MFGEGSPSPLTISGDVSVGSECDAMSETVVDELLKERSDARAATGAASVSSAAFRGRCESRSKNIVIFVCAEAAFSDAFLLTAACVL